MRRQAETALRNSEQQLRELAGNLLTAQEDERRRVARELHDDVTQTLAFLSIELGRLAGDLPDTIAAKRDRVRALQEQTLRASQEVRRLSHGLHPSVIEDFGLSVALEEFCEEFEKAQGVRVRFDGLGEDARLNHAGAACLYRVAQESLRNAVQHGQANEISVELKARAESVRLRVRDNGKGFSDPLAPAKGGLGMISMRERMRLVNGTLTISSVPEQGTEVAASAPLT
jgi:signal transduction histidine kinase